MTLPALVFGALMATFLGAVFHVWKGGSLGKLLLYIIFAWVGFWGGEILAASLGFTFGSVGPLHLLAAIILAVAALFLGHWLSMIRQES